MDHGCTACTPWVLIFLLALLGSTSATIACMPGMSTPGITAPSGDIILEEGNPLEINCTLNPSHRQAHGRNSSHLTFYEDGKEVPPEYISTINETTIQLRVEHVPLSSIIYYCKLRSLSQESRDIAVCLNKVFVGSKPEEVQNFTCSSKNWESLTCRWSVKDNPVRSTYRILFNLQGRAARRYNATCPTDSDVKLNYCTWNISSTPLYRQPYEYYYFTLTGSNKLGNVTFPTVRLHHYAHVIPEPPVDLEIVNKTYDSAVLRWKIPLPLPHFPPGLMHKVEYHCAWAPKGHWEIANTSSLDLHKPELYFKLQNLYANTRYQIRVKIKSSYAVGENKWSRPATTVLRTAETIPGSSPKTDIGSFEILGGMPRREVYIYWQQIPKYLHNGDNFEYRIIQVEETGETKTLTPNETTMSYAKIKALSYNSYKFIIYASNSVGLSENPSVITIPSHTASLPEPLSFTKIAFGNGLYELSWKLPPDFKNIKNYTIFWCDNERDRPYQCTGFLNWTHVPHDVNIKNITVPDDKIYQFAISANTANSSSGLLWATCTVIHNKGIGKMKNVWVNKVGSKFIEIGWKLECSDRIGQVKGYRIYYCPIVSPINRTCRDPLKNTTVAGDVFNIHGNVTDLMPYTTYMVGISVISRGGEGLQSDPQLATTLESAPEPPYNVEVTDVTNSSMLVSWSPPRLMNGVLQYYEVHYNSKAIRVEGSTQVVLDQLPSYTNHSVYVTACTGSCSERSEIVVAATGVGNPKIIDRLTVKRMNISQFLVTWQPLKPSQRGGNLGFYELSVQELQEDVSQKNLTHLFSTSGTDYIVPVMDCKIDDKRRNYYFAVRAVNIDEHNNTYYGPWSEPHEHDSCFDSGITQLSVILWTSCVVVIALLGLAMWHYGKKLWFRCKEMQNVEVKLPPGLDPPNRMSEKDLMSMSSCGVVPRPGDVSNKRQPNDLADSELLLTKNERHGRNPSGDSSGCSSGHDSVSSSLTSNTQISTDSGAEVDQLKGLTEVAFDRPSQLHKSQDDTRWNVFSKLGRYNSSCGTHSTPNLSGDSDSQATSKYPCLSSCPSTGHLATGSDKTLVASTSSLYCKVGSVDQAAPTHPSTSYCRVGTTADDSSSSLRSQVPSSVPSKGYITLASVAEMSRPPATATPPSTSNGYVAHPPMWGPTSIEPPPPIPTPPPQTSPQRTPLPFTCNNDDSCKEYPSVLQLEAIPEHIDPIYCRIGRWPRENSSSSNNNETLSLDTPITDNVPPPVVKTNSYVKVGVNATNNPKTVVVPPPPTPNLTAPNPSGYVSIASQWPSDTRPPPVASTSSSYVPFDKCEVSAPSSSSAYTRVCPVRLPDATDNNGGGSSNTANNTSPSN